MNALCMINSMTIKSSVITTTPSSSNSVFGVANCLVRLDASDSANLSLGAANAVIYWKSSSTYASNVYMKTGVYTANGFPTWNSGTYPYIYFNNGGGSTVSSTSQGLASNNRIRGMIPYAQATYYIVCTTTNDAVASYHQVWRWASIASTYPSNWGLIELSNAGEKAAYINYQDTSANNFWNTLVSYTATVPLNTRTIICFTAANNVGRYLYCNGTLWSSNTSTFYPINNNTDSIVYDAMIISAGNDSRCWTGYVNEVLWYGNYHDFNTRYAIQANLVSKWGITGMYQAPVTWTVSGSVAISNTYYVSNMSSTSSLFLTGTAQPNRVAMTSFPSSSRLSGSWTIEFFVYFPVGWTSTAMAGSEAAIITFANTQPDMRLYVNAVSPTSYGIMYLWYSTGGPKTLIVQPQFMLQYGSWMHFAYTYNSSTNLYQCLCNGSYANTAGLSTATVTTNIGPDLSNYYFGARVLAANYTQGSAGAYLDAMRISNTVLYTPPYTVPTSYTVDANTVYVNYFEGANTSTSMSNSEYYYI